MNASSPTPAAAGEPKASPGKALVTGGASVWAWPSSSGWRATATPS